ncbi:CHAT domain-containing protein [Micromonospora sp. NBS 11-29]|uniref:CHAT domain-containing protein n=1 Tax=Micromonospora sp. NBS 11-29 TaxID=1960879 RepID=UPI000B76E6C3|nr:CHAT domain-containing protein [Micromonospora sp. NBS 11-29]
MASDHDLVGARLWEGIRLVQAYQVDRDLRRLDRAEELLRWVLRQASHAAKPGIAQNLSIVAVLRWERDPQRRHLDEAVALLRFALDGAAGEPGLATLCRYQLATALRRYAGPDELDEAIDLFRRLVRPVVGGPPDLEHLVGAAEALQARYRSAGRPTDLAEAVELYGRVLAAASPVDPRRRGWLRTWGNDLAIRWGSEGSEALLDEMVEVWRAMLHRHPDGMPDHAHCQYGLGEVLLRRYRLGHDPVDLEEAVVLLHQAARATAPDDDDAAPIAVVLSEALMARAGVTGDTANLDAASAVLAATDAVDDTAHPHHVAVLLQLIGVRLAAYRIGGAVAALDQAIGYGRRALAAAGDGGSLNVTAAREVGGEPADLDKAIDVLRPVLAGPADGNHTSAVVQLAACLLTRAQTTRHTADCEYAVALLRAELARLARHGGPDHHRRSALRQLGAALMQLYRRRPEPAILTEAADAYLAIPEGIDERHPDAIAAVVDAADLAQVVHQETGDVVSLDFAVGLFRRVLALAGPADPQRHVLVDKLGYALRKRYDAGGDPADLRECVEVMREAVSLFPARHPGQMESRFSLVQALRAEHLRTGEPGTLREAERVATVATEVRAAPVSRRVEAWAMLGHVRASLGRWAEATEALATAVALLPRLASRDRLRVDQHHDLAGTAGLAGAAAAIALTAGQPERALELLEQGRGVLLSRRLTARDGLAALWLADPELAREYVRLRREMDAPEPGGPGAEPSAYPGSRDREAEWAALLRRVRALPGLAGFLRPATASELLAGVGGEPVVVISPSLYRCDALVLRHGRLAVLPLPELTMEAATAAVDRLRAATARAHDAGVRARDRLAAQQTVREILDWLWRVAVRPVLDHLGFPVVADGARPRLWWCATGPMAFFPLHAAEPVAGRDGALDRVVSSYTPTVEALRRLRSAHSDGPGDTRTYVVAMPETPGGFAALPAAPREAEAVAATRTDVEVDTGPTATRERMLRGLAAATHVHLACHALGDPHDPSMGRLLNHDHAEHPLTVGDIADLGLTDSHLAFLAACSTARSTPALADEAVHITGAFQIAGFRHVIGTLWETDDAASLEIARRFYAAPADRPEAYALHTAARALRDRYRRTPTLWATHVHLGP